MKEFVFDVKLWAVARVTAETEAEARRRVVATLDCIDVGFCENGVRITEASAEGTVELIDEIARVRLMRDVDNYPTVFVPAGETGVITEQTEEYTWVRLDRHYPELDEWQNCLQIWRWDYELPVLEPIAA